MIELLSGRDLEGMNGAALRIQLGHHILDDTVLARCVDPLQDDEQRSAILGVEPFLEIRRDARRAL